ncbi:MAG: type II toxin-antitoxin system VapC family toxin [Pseudomonadota bacterium]
MIFLDSNIPMYLVGMSHPHKDDTIRVLEKCIRDNQRLVTDVEVFQEILHRYTAIHRIDAIQPAFDALEGIVDQIFPIDHDDVLSARDIVFSTEGISARDALHVAVMKHYQVASIFSFDQGFDRVQGIQRIF